MLLSRAASRPEHSGIVERQGERIREKIRAVGYSARENPLRAFVTR